MSSNRQENTPLGNLLGAAGFFLGLYIGWKASGNVWATLIVGVILGATGAAVGNIAFRLIVIALAIVASLFMAQVRHSVLQGVWRGISSSTSSQQVAVDPNSRVTSSPPSAVWQSEPGGTATPSPPSMTYEPVGQPPTTQPWKSDAFANYFLSNAQEPKSGLTYPAWSSKPPILAEGIDAAKAWSVAQGFKLLPPIQNASGYKLSVWLFYTGVDDKWKTEGPYTIGIGTTTYLLEDNDHYITSKSPIWYWYAEAAGTGDNWVWEGKDLEVPHNGKMLKMRLWSDAERQKPWRLTKH